MAKKKKHKKDKQDKPHKHKTAKVAKHALAEIADKYALYGLSVQDASNEVDFFNATYKKLNGRRPHVLREDFCGTHAVCCEWVKDHKDNIAIGVDLDPEPLAWGKANLQSKLTEKQLARLTLHEADVRAVGEVKADVLAAQNFSFFLFKTRDALREYFGFARENLADDGIMVMDMMGGSDCHIENHQDIRTVESDIEGFSKFKYIWEQHRFNPISADALFYIHFKFRDGSKLNKAFTYDWRFWTLPEVCELATEAGFSDVTVYWEGVDKDGEPNGEFAPATEGPADPSWIAYVVARK